MAALAPDFAKMVPGFDFLQGLVKNASSVMPNIGQWVAPTLDPEVIDKRIDELRTVQFWLEQNARMLAATIQALEVQRMTLSTLRTMNVQVSDLQEAMRIKVPDATPAAAARSEPREASPDADNSALRSEDEDAPPAATGLVDPMQWWGALTQQFTQLATEAMKEVATDPARAFAGSIQAMNPAHAPSPKPAPARKPAAAGPAPSGTASATTTARKPAAGKKAPARKTAARKTARRAAT